MSAKTLHMETTKIDPGKTASEIQQVLGDFGCQAIMTEYDGARNACGMSFIVNLPDGRGLSFRLPINVQPIFQILNGRRKYSIDRENNKGRDMEQARRVAWRQVLRWIQAQLALIEVGMVRTEEVFLPYMTNNQGLTLYQAISDGGFSFPQLEHKPLSEEVTR